MSNSHYIRVEYYTFSSTFYDNTRHIFLTVLLRHLIDYNRNVTELDILIRAKS